MNHLQNQQRNGESTSNISENFSSSLANIEERKLPWPGGVKQEYEMLDIHENKNSEEIFKNKPIEVYS